MSYQADAVVIGAGVVGLACARRLALAGLETIVLEAEKSFGQGISSRNSEVLHAGIYYEPGSLKAKLCRVGQHQLYEYCERHNVRHRRVGKLIVATSDEQLSHLDAIRNKSNANGCDDIVLLDGDAASAHEPALSCVGALLSPSTGIIDTHELMLSLAGEVDDQGGAIVFSSPVLEGNVSHNGINLRLADAAESSITAPIVVNSGGLSAPIIAASLNDFPATLLPAHCFAKGSYFSLAGTSPFTRLIYPVPEKGGLGIHMTLDLQGRARFGPDVEWVDTPEYTVDAEKMNRFLSAIKTYWPSCSKDRLQPAYAGVRPKIGTPEKFLGDFMIQCEETHHIPGLVNLFGIESPGLTSCLAIADEVASRVNIH